MTKNTIIETIVKLLKGLSVESLKKVLEYTEALVPKIIKVTNIDRSRTIMEAIKATGRTPYLNEEVVKSMPKCEENGDSVEFTILESNEKDRSCKEVADWHKDHPADPLAALKHIKDNPDFVDDKPLAMQWEDDDGNYRYLILSDWGDDRKVNVDRHGTDWNARYRFVGLSQKP